MRIAYLAPNYLTSRGGAEIAAHRLAGELARLWHDVTMVAAAGTLAPFPEAPYRVVALRRARFREQVVRKMLALEKVRGGYRLAQWLFRSGHQRLLALGPCCPELENPRWYADFDVVVLIHGGTAWTVQVARAVGKMAGKLTVAMPLLHVREDSAA